MKLSIVLLAGLAAAACLRSRSAALRHWVLAAAILGAGALPLAERAVPDWPVASLFTTADSAAPAVSVDISVPAERRTPAAAPRGNARSPAAWFALIWIAGTVLFLSILAAGMARLAWLTARAHRPSPRWIALAREVCESHDVRRRVTLVQSDHPSLLATWGILRPRIIVPAAATAWPDDLVRVILHHEIAHIRRGDWLLQIAGELLRAIYWINPLTWMAAWQMRAESERACDDDVLRSGVEPSAYAAHLLTLARQFSRHRPWLPAPAMARRSTLHRRVAAMLNTEINRRPLTRRTRLSTIAAVLAATFVIAAAQTSATLSGTLVDPQGAVLPGVRVTLTNADTQATLSADTTRTGQFQFAGLPPGNYALRAELPGFKSYQETVSVGSANVQRMIALQIGQLRETVAIVDGGDVVAPSSQAAAARPNPPCGPQPAAGDVRIGGNIRPPHKIKDVRPSYPASLRGTGASAEVVLDAVIGLDGFIHDIRPRPGSQQAFVDAFVEAVMQWQFDSTLLNCVPIEVPITVTGHFSAR